MERGDVVEVLYVGEQGFWEGRIKDRTGWFPNSCIQELKKTTKKEKNRTWFGKKSNQKDIIEKCAKPEKPAARVVHLKKIDRGFGFQLRGANSHTAHIEFTPSAQFPALQYIGEVDKGGVAEKAGLKSGDFVIEVNGENVACATHGHVVTLVANSGRALTMKVVTISPGTSMSLDLADGGQKLQAKSTPSPTTGTSPTGSNDTAKNAPPPLPRSQYSSLTVGNLSSNIVLSDAQLPANVDTVMTIDKKVQKKRSVKGMWSDTALTLRPDVIKTEEISKGVVRRTKGTSANVPEGPEDEIRITRSNSLSSRSSASSPNLTKYAPPTPPVARSLSQSSSAQNIGETQQSDAQNRPTVPPNYEVTLENMRRLGRKPSFQRSDSEKKQSTTVEGTTSTRSRTTSTSSDVGPSAPIPDRPSYSPPPPPPAEEQSHLIRSMSLPAKPEAIPLSAVGRSSSESARDDSPSDDDEQVSEFAKALRRVAAARKERTRGSKLSIDETLNLRKKEQCLQVIKENEESTKTFTGQCMPKSSSSDALLQHKEGKGSDQHNLYAASSTSSLDTQTSKDSGIDVSEVMNQAPGEQPPDLASALANAVARRAEKIAKKESITKPVDQKEVVKSGSQLQQELISVKLKPTNNAAALSTSVTTHPANAPPPIRPKPLVKVPSERPTEQTIINKDITQQDTHVQSGVHGGIAESRNEVVTPPPMFTLEANEAKEHTHGSSFSDALPSPPVEFLDGLRHDTEKVGFVRKVLYILWLFDFHLLHFAFWYESDL